MSSSNNGVSKAEAVKSISSTDNKNEIARGTNGNVLSANLAALSIRPMISFRLWHFDCGDFPVHKHYFPRACQFCYALNNFRMDHPNGVDESDERWDSYLNRGREFEDAQALVEYVQALIKIDTEGVLPSKQSKTIFFNKKLGTAFFRADVPPKAESAENRDGGMFHLLLMATTGSDQHVRNFDKPFVDTVKRMAKMPMETLKMVNGVFCHCEINPGKKLPRDVPNLYADPLGLPFIAKLEIWIEKVGFQDHIERELIQPIKTQLELLALPENAFRGFQFLHHLKHREGQ